MMRSMPNAIEDSYRLAVAERSDMRRKDFVPAQPDTGPVVIVRCKKCDCDCLVNPEAAAYAKRHGYKCRSCL